MTPLAWSLLTVVVLLVAARALLRWRAGAPARAAELERLRRLALGEGWRGGDVDGFERRLEELGWKGALNQWCQELASEDADVRLRASDALWNLCSDDRDTIPALEVAFDEEASCDQRASCWLASARSSAPSSRAAPSVATPSATPRGRS